MPPNFQEERLKMVRKLQNMNYIKSDLMAEAMKKVPREEFMPKQFKNRAYDAYNAYPIPPFTGYHTISAPNTYPLFYESLDLQRSDTCLEIGTGSGYGAALLQEMVGKEGQVITIERNQQTYRFGKDNLKRTAYKDVIVVHGDGTKGYRSQAPYDKIIVTASFFEIPTSLQKQLAMPGKLVMPVGRQNVQHLTLLEKDQEGNKKEKILDQVIYVPLHGKYGYKKDE